MSTTALSFVLIIGATTALFMGLPWASSSTTSSASWPIDAVAARLHDGCLGVSAYSAAMFHLVTHAFFQGVAVSPQGSR